VAKGAEYSFLFMRQDILLEALKEEKFKSILEIGCGYGKNLLEIQINYPDAKIEGCDYEEFYTGFPFKIADITKRLPYENKEFDIVFTFACLLYVEGKDINHAIGELKRVGKKIILIEIHSDSETWRGIDIHNGDTTENKRIIRNYRQLLGEKAKYIKIDEDWPGRNYYKDACGMIIKL